MGWCWRSRWWRGGGSTRGGYRPFLQHVTGGRPVATRPLRVRQPRRLPRTLTEDQMLTLVEACEHLRDRFLLLLLAETGMRIGQALGLRHADFVSHRRELRIVPRRDNTNGARAKTPDEHTIPISPGAVRLYTAYMSTNTGSATRTTCSCTYSPNRTDGRCGTRPCTSWSDDYGPALGSNFTLHMLRHSRATELLRAGVNVDVVARLLTHRSSTTTSQTYAHLDVDELRAELTRHDAWDRRDLG